jgi:hypothetical protein
MGDAQFRRPIRVVHRKTGTQRPAAESAGVRPRFGASGAFRDARCQPPWAVLDLARHSLPQANACPSRAFSDCWPQLQRLRIALKNGF